MGRLKVGIIGCGVIGAEIAIACQDRLSAETELIALYDIDVKKSAELSSLLKKDVVVSSSEELIDRSDLVIEAANSSAAREIVKRSVETGTDVMVMSIGGLIDSSGLLEAARKKNVRVFFPSGALCGIDGLKAAKLSYIKSVTLTTRKPPKGLEGAPYLRENGIEVSNIKEETVIFDGTADNAVKGFPKNINVASLLSLAGVGADRTKVRIIAVPGSKKNIHEVEIEGEFGKIVTRTENVPSRKNPKTSELAILSAIATLKNMTDSVRMGT
ncbi:MAG: aspartate dehydrogenase [Candidatus Omnitrophota bacterium]